MALRSDDTEQISAEIAAMTTTSRITETVPIRVDEHGVMRVGRTRLIFDLVVQAFNDGATAEEIVLRYSVLSLADTYVLIGYYLRHKSEIDAYLHRRQSEADEIRKEIEARFPSEGIRERLLARKAARHSLNDAEASGR